MSLLSAVDGMIRTRHESNMELVAQGVAKLASPIFGGRATDDPDEVTQVLERTRTLEPAPIPNGVEIYEIYEFNGSASDRARTLDEALGYADQGKERK